MADKPVTQAMSREFCLNTREQNCTLINRNEEAYFDVSFKGEAMTLEELAECEFNSRDSSQTSGPTTCFLMGYIKG
jgi:hypothetical protein